MLNLDDHINNTSLVLAFELGQGEDASVLLFPGDAQVGNWLSWDAVDPEGKFVEDLLRRTVLYKVGHHASHNATLKAKGLLRMTRTDRLVAMIPIDEIEAHKPKGKNPQGWDMPYGNLLKELESRTEGRIMRSDTGVALIEKKEKPTGWDEAQVEAVSAGHAHREQEHRDQGKAGEPSLLHPVRHPLGCRRLRPTGTAALVSRILLTPSSPCRAAS